MSKLNKEKLDICGRQFAEHFPFQHKVLNEFRTDPLHKWSKQFVKETSIIEEAFYKAWELSAEQLTVSRNNHG